VYEYREETVGLEPHRECLKLAASQLPKSGAQAVIPQEESSDLEYPPSIGKQVTACATFGNWLVA